MSDSNQPVSKDALTGYLAPGGSNVKLVYVLYLASVLIGLTVLVGLVMAYINRPQVSGTWTESHYTYLIRTFWIGLLYSAICVVLMFIGIGFLLLFAVLVWAIIRCVKGLQWASASNPVPNPTSWMI